VGALLTIERGLLIEAHILVRSCLENVAQGIAFMREPHTGAAWMNGKTFTPGAIRQKLGGQPDLKPAYDRLSKIAHANPDARWMHSIQVPPDGVAIGFGGAYKPKEVAETLVLLTRVILLYVEEFLRQYGHRLDLVAWPLLIEVIKQGTDEIEAWVTSLPDDLVALREYAKKFPVTPMPTPPITTEEMEKLRAQVSQSFAYAGPSRLSGSARSGEGEGKT
jgi:hypothetical protein